METHWLVISVLSLVFGACGGKVSGDSASEASGGTTHSTGSGGTTSTSRPLSAAGKAALGGATTVVAKVAPCSGVPAVADEVQNRFTPCNGVSVEYEPIPVDMVILMDRSIANSYAVGASSAAPAAAGELRRWDVLISAMAALAASPSAGYVGASLTLFGTNEPYSDGSNCAAANYTEPAVPMNLLSVSGPQIVATMQATTPAGLTPLVPALTGAYQYVTARKQQDPSREPILVLFTNSYPTQCSLKSPADVVRVITEAASAEIPVRTFIVGVGSTFELRVATPALEGYARAGNTYKSPYLLDEAADTAAFPEQLLANLFTLYGSPIACAYQIDALASHWMVDPEKVSVSYRPLSGGSEEYLRVANADACAISTNGGWYFDDPLAPTKLTLCPCSCVNSTVGGLEVLWGCRRVVQTL